MGFFNSRRMKKFLLPVATIRTEDAFVACGAEHGGMDLRRGDSGGLKPVAPLFVSRMVALAKASSVAAAIIAGFAAGFDFYLAGSLTASTPRQDALTAAITFVAAVLLACAALYLEYCCRVPGDPEEPQPDH